MVQNLQIDLTRIPEEWRKQRELEEVNFHQLRKRSTALRKQNLWLESVLLEISAMEYWMIAIIEENDNLSELALMGTGRKTRRSIVPGDRIYIGALITILKQVVENDSLIEFLRKLNDFRNDIAHGLYKRNIDDIEVEIEKWFSQNNTLNIHREFNSEMKKILDAEGFLITQKSEEMGKAINKLMEGAIESNVECTEDEIQKCVDYIVRHGRSFLNPTIMSQLSKDVESKFKSGFFLESKSDFTKE